MKNNKWKTGIVSFVLLSAFCFLLSTDKLFAQEAKEIKATEAEQENVTIDFKDADIANVLRILSYKSGVNIIAAEDVQGTITIRLNDVPWETALNVILKTYGFAYERDGNIITVSTLENILARQKTELELSQVQLVITKTFVLTFLDASDVKNVLQPQLSPRGKITVLETTGQTGWEFGGAELGKRKRLEGARISRSKTLIVSDIAPYMEKIEEVIKKLDVPPEQVLIEARLVEVNEDTLRDLGIDWGTGVTGAESSTITGVGVKKTGAGEVVSALGAHGLTSQTPAIFSPEQTAITAANTGLKLVYSKLRGTQFQTILHALEEDVRTNTLSAPRIMTLNNQEAAILVGTKYPIIKSETEEGVTSTSLDYYQDIGIQLNVVPQLSGDDYINMIVHPAVTTSTTQVEVTGGGKYPIISTREAETQILIKNGETIVIGGLLKDVKSKGKFSVPILGKIPILGLLFQRDTTDIEKIDLLIFITAHVVKPEETPPREVK